MNVIDRLRVWWQVRTGEEETPLDGDAPAWVVSMVVHLGLLVLLTAITLLPYRDEDSIVLSTSTDEEQLEEVQRPEEFVFSEEKVADIGANSFAGEMVALAAAPVEADVSEVPLEEFQADVGQLVELTEASLATGPNVSNAVVRGAQGVGTDGAMGAIDRLTREILLSLEQRPTLVVWIFDQSGSLQRQRQAIHDRFDRVYRELGVIEQSGNEAFSKHENQPLLTHVAAFGQEYKLLTREPTDDVQKIKAAVASIENDASGIENVFQAVTRSATKCITYRTREEDERRNVMLVVFSDEVGDDQHEGLDPTVQLCRRYQMPVYVVGVPAPFGREVVNIRYVDPDPQYDQSDQWIPIRQGPETMFPERIKLSFGKARDEPIDSGFGPYSLTRLCYETGGIYFAVHPNRNQGQRNIARGETAELSAHIAHFFHPAKMRGYRPDYVSAAAYQQLLASNRARRALVEASSMTWASSMANPRRSFPKQSEADLANLLSAAQRDAARLEPQLLRLYDVLSAGEPDRPKVTQLRWQAGYDLAMGRTLAVVARVQSYNAMLASAKQGMKFQNAKNDTWRLEPANEISIGSAVEKLADKARVYLERVVREHEGTPWALLAQRELNDPIGWRWVETYTGVNAPRVAAAGNNNNPRRDDQRREMAKPKPKRKPAL